MAAILGRLSRVLRYQKWTLEKLGLRPAIRLCSFPETMLGLALAEEALVRVAFFAPVIEEKAGHSNG